MKFICFDTIDSTNTYLKNNYLKLDNLCMVSALNQSQGKGRNNREWYSDGTNLLCSLLLKDRKYFAYYKAISILSAYAIIKVLEEYGVKDLSIKWPNDIYHKDQKLCGILLESISTNEMQCLIVGIGLNVNQTIFDKQYNVMPTSMKSILNDDVDIEILKAKIYESLINCFNRLVSGYDFYNDIKAYDYLKNKEAYALINNQNTKVNIIGINNDYSLAVKYNDVILDMEAGEISFHI